MASKQTHATAGEQRPRRATRLARHKDCATTDDGGKQRHDLITGKMVQKEVGHHDVNLAVVIQLCQYIRLLENRRAVVALKGG